MALGIHDHAVQNFGHARWVAHFFLIANHVLKQRHLLHFLEATLPNGFIRSLRRDQQKWRVVPISGLHGRHKIGNARPILRNHHAHFARRTGKAISHHAARTFMRAIPERDARFRKNIRNRHER